MHWFFLENMQTSFVDIRLGTVGLTSYAINKARFHVYTIRTNHGTAIELKINNRMSNSLLVLISIQDPLNENKFIDVDWSGKSMVTDGNIAIIRYVSFYHYAYEVPTLPSVNFMKLGEIIIKSFSSISHA